MWMQTNYISPSFRPAPSSETVLHVQGPVPEQFAGLTLAMLEGTQEYRPTSVAEEPVHITVECKDIPRHASRALIFGLIALGIGLNILFATSKGGAVYSSMFSYKPALSNNTKPSIHPSDSLYQTNNTKEGDDRSQPTWADVVKKKPEAIR